MSELNFNTTKPAKDLIPSDAQDGNNAPLLPEVSVVPYDGPEVRNRALTRGHAIYDTDGVRVGTFNLAGPQGGERRWINDVRIDTERQGERLAVAAYAGLIATLAVEGTKLISDLQGLSDSSERVWRSLSRRGLASETQEKDVHGYSRYTT